VKALVSFFLHSGFAWVVSLVPFVHPSDRLFDQVSILLCFSHSVKDDPRTPIPLLVAEGLAFLCGMTIIMVVMAILAHISVRWVLELLWQRDEFRL